MIALVVAALLLALVGLPALQLATGGIATYTYPGAMEEAARNQGVAPCPECIGMVALADKERIGERVWLQRIGRQPEGQFLVVDCAGRGPRPPRWLVEVDYETSLRWGMRAPIFITLWREER